MTDWEDDELAMRTEPTYPLTMSAVTSLLDEVVQKEHSVLVQVEAKGQYGEMNRSLLLTVI